MTASVSESLGGEVAAYDSGNAYSDYGALGGRRRVKRNSRRSSRRRSKKYMRKMYRGGEGAVNENGGSAQTEQQTEQVTTSNIAETQDGGRRRRGKTQKGKIQKGKTRKGKTRKGKVSKWITHVKNFSRANKMDFRDALKDPKCKATYHKMK